MRLNLPARKLTALLLACVLSPFATGFAGSCGKNDDGTPKTTEQKVEEVMTGVAGGLSTAARGIESGIDTVRQFRLAGKIKPDTSLWLARKAQAADRLIAGLASRLLERGELMPDERATVLDDIEELLTLAGELEGFHVSDGSDAQLVFNLGVITAKSALRIAADEFRGQLPPGLIVRLTDDQKARLTTVRSVSERNRKRLADSIELLSR